MMSETKSHSDILAKHYEHVWSVDDLDVGFVGGPTHALPDGFKILEFKPHRDRAMWTYATCGMSSENDVFPVELHMFSPKKSGEPVEVLVATAHFHRTGSALCLGHTVNFGKPWIEQSPCDHGLISLPYLDGPSLENLEVRNATVKCLWLIPITKSEVEFKKKHGLDALENRFDEMQFNYLDSMRNPVC